MKKISITILSIILGVGTILILAYFIGFGKIREATGLVSLKNICLLALISFIQSLLTCIALRRILFSFGIRKKMDILSLYNFELIKSAISYITPFLNTGGEPLQIYLLKKYKKVPLKTGISAVVLDKVLRLSLSIALVFLGILITFFVSRISIKAIILIILIILPAVLMLYFFYKKSLVSDSEGIINFLLLIFCGIFRLSFLKKIKDPVGKIDKAITYFLKNKVKEILILSYINALIVLSTFLQFYIILNSLNYNPTLSDLLIIFTVFNLSILIPIPAGLGVFEVGGTGIFIIQGIGANLGFVFALVLRVVNIITTIPGLILTFHYGIRLRKAIKISIKTLVQHLGQKTSGNGIFRNHES